MFFYLLVVTFPFSLYSMDAWESMRPTDIIEYENFNNIKEIEVKIAPLIPIISQINRKRDKNLLKPLINSESTLKDLGHKCAIEDSEKTKEDAKKLYTTLQILFSSPLDKIEKQKISKSIGKEIVSFFENKFNGMEGKPIEIVKAIPTKHEMVMFLSEPYEESDELKDLYKKRTSHCISSGNLSKQTEFYECIELARIMAPLLANMEIKINEYKEREYKNWFYLD